MSEISQTPSKKSEKIESDFSKQNQENQEQGIDNEEEKKNNKQISLFPDKLYINETKRYLKKLTNKKIITEDKQVQNGNITENKISVQENTIIKELEEEKNKEIEELKEKIKFYEEKIKFYEEKLKIIDQKDLTIKKLSALNQKLKNSLEQISQKMDDKIFLFKNRKNNYNTGRLRNNQSCENLSRNNFNLENGSNNIVKEKELNNAVNMIKILRNDNRRLQDKIDEIEKNKEEEKKNKDRKQLLLEKEMKEHKLWKQRIESFQDKIRKLKGKNKIEYITNINNRYYDSDGSDDEKKGRLNSIKRNIYKKTINLNDTKDNKKGKYLVLKRVNIRSPLPNISSINGKQSNLNKNANTIININNLFNVDEMNQLNKIFLKNINIYNIILKKFDILQKSKDSIDNKYKLVQKQLTKRIYSMQQQIDFLNSKIKESELKVNILQSQLNENKLEKRTLLKRIKILSEGLGFNGFNPNEGNFNKSEKKKNKKRKFNENKFQEENSLDNSENKGKKLNNISEIINESQSLSEEDFYEITNKNKKIKSNKSYNDDIEKDSKLF